VHKDVFYIYINKLATSWKKSRKQIEFR